MIGKDSGITGKLSAVQLLRDTEKANEKAIRRALKVYLKWQEANIITGKSPKGGAQPPNLESTKKSKKKRSMGSQPLWDKGILKDPKLQRIRKDKDMGILTVLPPKTRAAAVAILAAKNNLVTIYDPSVEFPKWFLKLVDKFTQEELDKADKKRGA